MNFSKEIKVRPFITKNEWLNNGVWEKLDIDDFFDNYYDKIRRAITVHPWDPHYVDYTYFLGEKIHRLTGPAWIVFNHGKVNAKWHVNNIWLEKFEDYYIIENIVNKIFEYAARFPIFIPQLIILAEHNHWLDEEHIFLLKSLSAFAEVNSK